MADELLPVTAEDRAAVQAFHREMGRRLMSDIKTGSSLLDAKGEDSDVIYQAFAAHRIATEARLSTDAEVLRDSVEFNRGYMIAVSNIMNLHGEDTIARNVLEQLGATKADMERMGFDDYDLDQLRPLFREMARRDKLARTALSPTIDSADGGGEREPVKYHPKWGQGEQPCVDPHAGVEVLPHLLEPVRATQPDAALREALEPLVAACEAEFTSDLTEVEGDPENGPWREPDDEAVSHGMDEDTREIVPGNITFGMIRRARADLDTGAGRGEA